MILLLQIATQGTPITVYVTIGAAFLATLASLNATRVSSKTAKEVAAQAAQTARDSAKIAADTAREIKTQDYKFDFYKKIIEKRLNAWSEAEQLFLPLMATVYIDEQDNKRRFSFCAGPEKFAAMLEITNKSLTQQAFWIGGSYASNLIKFRDELLAISHECFVAGKYNSNGTPLPDKVKLYKAGAERHEMLKNITLGMAGDLTKQILDLHDVEKFLVSRIFD